MRVLATSGAIHSELIRLIDECASCQIAVAWATMGFEALARLRQQPQKIEKMVIGTHFWQTAPEFIEAFLDHESVRFMVKTDGVFHPKLYLFKKPGGHWECVIGSANFTCGGMSQNQEVAVVVTQADIGSVEALCKIEAAIGEFWCNATRLTVADLKGYREHWHEKQRDLGRLEEEFETSINVDWLMEVARTVANNQIATFASRDKAEKVYFSMAPDDSGIDFRPSSGTSLRVSRAELQKFCDKYLELGGVKKTTPYMSFSGVSSYVITLIDLAEKARH